MTGDKDGFIKFYTQGLKPGEVAQFSFAAPAPWGGSLRARGFIIHSRRDKRLRVQWYAVNGLFPCAPDGMGENAPAEEFILQRWKEVNWK